MLRQRFKNIFLLGAFLFFFLPLSGQAAEIEFKSPGLPSGVSVSVVEDKAGLPWEWTALSPVYEYNVNNSYLYDPAWPMEVTISYDGNNNFKQIFIIDALSGRWEPLLSEDFPKEKYVKTKLTTTSGHLVLLSNDDLMSTGVASWYSYKNGDFAASPDFLKGSVLRVTNLDNGKYVDVTVNDYGPERDKHPDRVIDLDKVAFSKIASPSAGLINVKVDPLKIIRPTTAKVQISDTPIVSATSALVFWEEGDKILFGKEETRVASLASLTKLVSIKTFLDLNPNLNQVVSYKFQDEKYNHLYCLPWESARLTVKEGDTLTIENLIYSSLVGSANNAVETLVRVSGLSRDAFVVKMNENVKSWGASSTKFVEPTGLSPDNVSSPYDYAIITTEVFKNPLIEKVSTTKSYSFSTINTKKLHRLNNTNQLLRSGKYNIVGSKTGYLHESGNCLMTRIKTDKGNLIVINFGSPSREASFQDNEQLIRYGLRQLEKMPSN